MFSPTASYNDWQMCIGANYTTACTVDYLEPGSQGNNPGGYVNTVSSLRRLGEIDENVNAISTSVV